MTDPKYMRPGVPFALGKLVEEIGEFQMPLAQIQAKMAHVLFAIGKTQRWGLDSKNPELPDDIAETNEDLLYENMMALFEEMVRQRLQLEREWNEVFEAMQNVAKEVGMAQGQFTEEEWEENRRGFFEQGEG